MGEYGRATADYTGTLRGELSFKEGDIIEIRDKSPNGWWLGQNPEGDFGCFPYHVVELLPGIKGIEDLNKLQNTMSDHRVTMDSIFSESESLFRDINVTGASVAKKVIAFNLAVAPRVGKVVGVSKTMGEFRILDQVIEAEVPMLVVPKLPPVWADNTDFVITEAMAQARVEVLDSYLMKLLTDPFAEVILHNWLFPDKGVSLQPKVKRQLLSRKSAITEMRTSFQSINTNGSLRSSLLVAIQNVPVLAKVKAAWLPRDDVELGLQAGETVAVLKTRNTSLEGWWEAQNAAGKKGLIPYMYVELYTKKKTTEFYRSAQETLNKNVTLYPKGTKTKRKSKTMSAPISEDCRMDLMAVGIAVEQDGEEAELPEYEKRAHLGDMVSMSYKAHVWNPDTEDMIQFDDVDGLEFVVGNGEVIEGLNEAVQRLQKDSKVRCFLSPNLAYGSIGYPPMVPPDAFLVYDIFLKEIFPPPPPEENDNSFDFGFDPVQQKLYKDLEAIFPEEIESDDSSIGSYDAAEAAGDESNAVPKRSSKTRKFVEQITDANAAAMNPRKHSPKKKNKTRFAHLQAMVKESLNKERPTTKVYSNEPIAFSYSPSDDSRNDKYKAMVKKGATEVAIITALEQDGVDPSGFVQNLLLEKSKVVEEYKSKLERTLGGSHKHPLLSKPVQQRVVRHEGNSEPNYKHDKKKFEMFTPSSPYPKGRGKDKPKGKPRMTPLKLPKQELARPPRDDPAYQKYKDMLTNGIRMKEITQQMRNDGIDPSTFADNVLGI